MAMDLNAKAAYIRGMMKGMEFDPTTQEGKIIVAMMDLLEEMADVVSEHDDALDQAFDELDAIDEDMEDLISIGTIGLMKAIATYKEDYGSRLATYAARCIDNELLMYFRAKKKVSREVSLYEPIGMDKEGNQIHLLDIVESEEPDVVEMMERTRQIEKLLGLVPKVLQERELYIVVHRYGLFGNKAMTQREIASAVGISRSYVSRIEKKALDKLKKSFCE